MRPTYNQAFGAVLRALRNEKKLTQDGLALHADLDRSYISLLESGRRSPSLDTLMALCRALRISLTELAARLDAEFLRRERRAGHVGS
ncbi:helix-turn-helix domain-containing protein [Achromobacter ruhlandii]|uniref:helix-turn-helix domain-containing protein n=1 Tax=Achromobacter ruhlandii TaxID=72557 RepID=UPI003B9EA92E